MRATGAVMLIVTVLVIWMVLYFMQKWMTFITTQAYDVTTQLFR